MYGDPTIPPSWGVFGGLNLGLAAGLALAYLPDQSVYGPSWQHVMLVDLATAAGAIGGAVFDVLSRCIQEGGACEFETTNDEDRRRIARSALIGGTLGLATGWLLTRNYDEGKDAPPLERSTISLMTMPTLFPVEVRRGRAHRPRRWSPPAGSEPATASRWPARRCAVRPRATGPGCPRSPW